VTSLTSTIFVWFVDSSSYCEVVSVSEYGSQILLSFLVRYWWDVCHVHSIY